MNRPKVASERKRGEGRGSADRARSTDQYAPSGNNIPQKSNMRNRRLSAPLTSGLRDWIESSNTHATKVMRRVRYPTSIPSVASAATPNSRAWKYGSPFMRFSENTQGL